jgi:hypothetical protein
MGAKNTNLHAANREKNDEFYTQLADIERECSMYKDQFQDKIIFCNCDDPEESNFWKYFELNFTFFGLKKLIATHFETDKPSYKLELVDDANGDGAVNKLDIIRTPLQQNGDFRSPECIEILKQADIIISNPPFSLFREYVQQLAQYDKKFLVIGNKNAITYKEIFKLIKEEQLWLGYTQPKEFKQPDGSVKKFGNICWFTNLETTKRQQPIDLCLTYTPEEYPKYDNYDAIEVSKVVNIPMDYDGVMGVPITFLDKHCPGQFEIIGTSDRGGDDIPEVAVIRLTEKKMDSPLVQGEKTYKRLFIRRK